MTTQTTTAYTIEIRRWTGQTLGEASGHSEWETTLIRLAAKVGLCARTASLHDEYFRTDAFYPFGTHHVQFGTALPRSSGGGTSLGRTYIVSVQPA